MLFHQGRIVSDNDVAGKWFCDGVSPAASLLSVAFTHHGAAYDYGERRKDCFLRPAEGTLQRKYPEERGQCRSSPPGNRQVFFGKGGCPWDAL